MKRTKLKNTYFLLNSAQKGLIKNQFHANFSSSAKKKKKSYHLHAVLCNNYLVHCKR